MRELIALGVAFDRDDGELSRGLEAAHPYARVLHAGGDATGAAIEDALIARVRDERRDGARATTVVDLRRWKPARCVGVELLDGAARCAPTPSSWPPGEPASCSPTRPTRRRDGRRSRRRCAPGAVAADLEFYQFHPTSLAVPGNFLVSEAVRGEGAVLIDDDGGRFMIDVHPDAELAPRDVVARGIAQQMKATSHASGAPRRHRPGRGVPGRALPQHRARLPRAGLDWAASRSRSRRPRTTGWAASAPTRGDAPPCPASTPSARSPAPGCTAPTGSPRTRCSKGAVFGARVIEAVGDAGTDRTVRRASGRHRSIST